MVSVAVTTVVLSVAVLLSVPVVSSLRQKQQPILTSWKQSLLAKKRKKQFGPITTQGKSVAAWQQQKRQLQNSNSTKTIPLLDLPVGYKVRLPGEHEPVDAVFLSYPPILDEDFFEGPLNVSDYASIFSEYNLTDLDLDDSLFNINATAASSSWLDTTQQVVDDIAAAVFNNTDVALYLLESPNGFLSELSKGSSNRSTTGAVYQSLPLLSDTVWVRDYGPIGIVVETDDGNVSHAIVDMVYSDFSPFGRIRDDRIPCEFAELSDRPCYFMNLTFEGGNLMSDGQGGIFTTKVVYLYNQELAPEEIDSMLKLYFGGHTVHALDYAMDENGNPLDGTGHIDMFCKILDPCKVMISKTDAPGFMDATESAAEYFSTLECAPGKFYEVFRTKGWVDETADPLNATAFKNIPGFETFNRSDWTIYTWITYTNSLIVNDLIIMPGYSESLGGNDTEAMLVYQKATNRTVVVVNSDGPIFLGGAVHCLSKQLPRIKNLPRATVFPELICIDAVPPSCTLDLGKGEVCADEKFHHDIIEEACKWKIQYLEINCCSNGASREWIFPDENPDDYSKSQNYTVTTASADRPWAWTIWNDTGDVVAASPIVFPGSLEGQNSTVNLLYGLYTVAFFDASGNSSRTDNMHSIDAYVMLEGSLQPIPMLTVNGYSFYHVGLLRVTEEDPSFWYDPVWNGSFSPSPLPIASLSSQPPQASLATMAPSSDMVKLVDDVTSPSSGDGSVDYKTRLVICSLAFLHCLYMFMLRW